MQVLPPIGDLIHELQKERGNSAGFIGSGGGFSFAKRLAQQRGQTGEVLEAYRQAVQALS